MHSFILKQILMDLFKYLSKRKLKKKTITLSYPSPSPAHLLPGEGLTIHPLGGVGTTTTAPQPALDSLYPPSALLGRELSALPLKLQSQDDT